MYVIKQGREYKTEKGWHTDINEAQIFVRRGNAQRQIDAWLKLHDSGTMNAIKLGLIKSNPRPRYTIVEVEVTCLPESHNHR